MGTEALKETRWPSLAGRCFPGAVSEMEPPAQQDALDLREESAP